MKAELRVLCCFALFFCYAVDASMVDGVWQTTKSPIVIGHRGAPSYRLEETLASYEIANFQNATFLEIDLCVTQDGYLVNNNENNTLQTLKNFTDLPTRMRA